MTSDHTPDGGAMDTRRIVVLDGEKCYCGHCGLDTTGTARQWARADRAPSLADLRERVAAACVQGANAQLDDPSRPWQSFAADAVLAALLGADPKEAPRGE